VYIPHGFEYEEINNFKYADYALGKFFRTVRNSNYFDNTVFVIVGDHGVHLRGQKLIPVEEYRVGALLYAPALLKPDRITRPTSQLDIAPTILGLLGGSYRSTFFGNDIFKRNEKSEYALMVYNKKQYGIISGSRFTILGKAGDNYTYRQDTDNGPWIDAPNSEESDKQADFAAAILQTAEKLLNEKKYHVNIDESHPFEK